MNLDADKTDSESSLTSSEPSIYVFKPERGVFEVQSSPTHSTQASSLSATSQSAQQDNMISISERHGPLFPPPGPSPNIRPLYIHSQVRERCPLSSNSESTKKASMSIASLIASDDIQAFSIPPTLPSATLPRTLESRKRTLPPVHLSLQTDPSMVISPLMVGNDFQSSASVSTLPLQSKYYSFPLITSTPVLSSYTGESSKRYRPDSSGRDEASPTKRLQTRFPQTISRSAIGVGSLHNRIAQQNFGQIVSISCLHSAVAQKSYGSEKRFLCPPPVVKIYGLDSQQSLTVSMAVTGSDIKDQKIVTNNESVVFKQLYIMGGSKSKKIRLQLDISHNNPNTDKDHWRSLPTISFMTDPVTVISKPPKKKRGANLLTSMQSGEWKMTSTGTTSGNWIVEGGRVAFYNRINSQTVRTKFLNIDRSSKGEFRDMTTEEIDGGEEGKFSADGGRWTGFIIKTLRSPNIAGSDSSQPAISDQNDEGGRPSRPILYNSIVILTDPETNLRSPPLIIRKLERGKLLRDEEQSTPVTQMQKVGLERASFDAIGRGEFIGARDEGLGYWTIENDRAEDVVCWTIVGVREMCETFVVPPPSPMAMMSGEHQQNRTITRPPKLLEPPKYNPGAHTLELVFDCHPSTFQHTNIRQPIPTSNKSENDGRDPETPERLHIFLGDLGPLPLRTHLAPLRIVHDYSSIFNASSVRMSSSTTFSADFDSDNDDISDPNKCRVVVDLPMASEETFDGRQGAIELPLWLAREDGVKFLIGGWQMLCHLSRGSLAKWAITKI
ncbi:uncharacterized protein VTP21DRAFT_3669 [Calcarisporiella thermophila]|uniref:uncharacterized protein n=1 Tax=Calcarisporiella thermophila TaxID=911321 RepID=UPI003743D499